MTTVFETDVIVLGAGVSALTAATHLAEQGHRVALACPGDLGVDSVVLRERGINSVLPEVHGEDSFAEHLVETETCGEHLAQPALVKDMVRQGHHFVNLAQRLGVGFHLTPEGHPRQTKGRASFRARRVTGPAPLGFQFLKVLREQVLRWVSRKRLPLFTHHSFLKLVLDDAGATRGCLIEESKTGQIKAIDAPVVVMASEGLSPLYGDHSLSSDASGVGVLGTLFRQGLRLSNLEFVEFEPFSLSWGRHHLLLPEFDKLEAADVSLNHKGESLYLFKELEKQALPHLKSPEIFQSWYHAQRRTVGLSDRPHSLTVSAKSLRHQEQIPFVKELLHQGSEFELRPVAGLSLGGLWVDERLQTSFKGVFAAGSCVAGYHGALSLPGNELLALYASGARVSRSVHLTLTAPHFRKGRGVVSLFDHAVQAESSRRSRWLDQTGPVSLYDIQKQLGAVLYQQAGIWRDNLRLQDALVQIQNLSAQMEQVSLVDKSSVLNQDLFHVRVLENSFALAQALVQSALVRDESRGSHAKPDFYKKQDQPYRRASFVTWRQGQVHFKKFIDETQSQNQTTAIAL